ncbi:MAG: hypothetical protein CSA81_02535 [Acidobacteria bacterium]|nr:MAG: hypothetical protein CSA81_02535 [Acidobacteriota bacterium]
MDRTSFNSALALIKSRVPGLSKSEGRVAEWLLAHPEEVRTLSMAEIASICHVSDTTVLRMARTIGFAGFTDLKIAVLQDIVNPTQFIHDDITRDDKPLTVTRKVFMAHVQSLYDTLDGIDSAVLDKVIKKIREAGSILIAGMGSSALLARHCNQQLRRLGINSRAPNDAHMQIIEASMQTEKDLTIGISLSGASVDILTAVKTAKKNGASTVAITGNVKSPLALEADHILLSVSHETRSDKITGRVGQMAILDALFVNLSLLDLDNTLEKERLITSSIIQKLE